MPDHIPFEIQEEIIKRLPMRSLIQFRSVSKPWKSFIDSSEFIAHYTSHNTEPQYLLYEHFEQKHVRLSTNDNDIVPEKFLPNMGVKLSKNLRLIVSSQGLYCTFPFRNFTMTTAILWNRSIRKAVSINVPNKSYAPYGSSVKTVIGFGSCRHTNNPKLVKTTTRKDLSKFGSRRVCWQVEVFTLSSGAWKTQSIDRLGQLDIDEFIYWLAFDGITMGSQSHLYDLIMSFDMTSEEIQVRNAANIDLFIQKLRAPLVVVKTHVEIEKQVYGIWLMEYDVPKSFTKRFPYTRPWIYIHHTFGIRESCEGNFGGVFIEKVFVVYKPSTHQINSIRIYGKRYTFFVRGDTHVLLLLDQ